METKTKHIMTIDVEGIELKDGKGKIEFSNIRPSDEGLDKLYEDCMPLDNIANWFASRLAELAKLTAYVNYVSRQISGEHVPLYLTEWTQWKTKQEKRDTNEKNTKPVE